ALLGFLVFLLARQRVLVGVVVPIILLAVGLSVLDIK
ncbi:AzlD domain-containing protein, partial [Klebsiella pneumoniae]